MSVSPEIQSRITAIVQKAHKDDVSHIREMIEEMGAVQFLKAVAEALRIESEADNKSRLISESLGVLIDSL